MSAVTFYKSHKKKYQLFCLPNSTHFVADKDTFSAAFYIYFAVVRPQVHASGMEIPGY